MATVTRLAYSDVNSAGDTVLTMPSAQAIGTYLVAIVGSSGGGSTLSFTDSAGNAWFQRGYASNASSPSAVCAIYTTANGGITSAMTTSTTLTLTSTAGSGAGDILLVKVAPDTDGTIAYHTSGFGTGSSNTPACSSFASVTTDLIISGLCESSATLNTQTTAGAGYTKLAGGDAHTQNRAVVGQYGVATGASTAPYVMSVVQQYATVAIALTQTNPPPAESIGECARGAYDSTTTKTINIPITVAVAAGQSVVMGVQMAAATPNNGMTVSDSKGNTWALADLCVQNGVGSNGQGFLIYCESLATGLTTSDTVTVAVKSNEIQTVTEGGSGLTSFTLTFSSSTTGSLAAAASAATVQTALEGLASIGSGNVAVSGSAGGPYTVTFQGSLANTNVTAMTATPTGGTGTVTVATTVPGSGIGNPQWAWHGIAYSGILDFDKAAHNNGASSASLNSGTTGAAAQNRQMVFAVFVGGGTGVDLDTIVPAGFTYEGRQATTTTIRNLWIIWGLLNTSGTRTVTAHMGDSTSHAWAGVVAAFNSNAAVPDTIQWHLPDSAGTGWLDAELVLAVGNGWDS